MCLQTEKHTKEYFRKIFLFYTKSGCIYVRAGYCFVASRVESWLLMHIQNTHERERWPARARAHFMSVVKFAWICHRDKVAAHLGGGLVLVLRNKRTKGAPLIACVDSDTTWACVAQMSHNCCWNKHHISMTPPILMSSLLANTTTTQVS